MAIVTAAQLESQSAEVNIELVVDDDDVFNLGLVIVTQAGHGTAGLIHKRFGLRDHRALICQTDFGYIASGLVHLPLRTGAPGQFIDHEKASIVTGRCVSFTRIT